jgi:nitrogen fixation protein NifU and related proteins
MDLYAENILDHYRHPHKKGLLADATVTHDETNVSCGDSLTLSLRIEGGRIAAVGWEGKGCAISQAGMSLLADELEGKTKEEAAALTEEHVRALLGVPIGLRRAKCAFLGLEAVRGALTTQ